MAPRRPEPRTAGRRGVVRGDAGARGVALESQLLALRQPVRTAALLLLLWLRPF